MDNWDHCGTNKTHTLLDVHLLFDIPYEHSGCRMHPRASQNLTVILYLHKQHTHTETYS
jgi:hypothetical protein